ncbi:MAG TPA: hypothetical protein VME46_19165, partial [Acidimicrobiales bacterium]|nr:hypothetical protein [Acidimicrobiales bacterium]
MTRPSDDAEAGGEERRRRGPAGSNGAAGELPEADSGRTGPGPGRSKGAGRARAEALGGTPTPGAPAAGAQPAAVTDEVVYRGVR